MSVHPASDASTLCKPLEFKRKPREELYIHWDHLPSSALELKMEMHLSLGTESIPAAPVLPQCEDHILHVGSFASGLKCPLPKILTNVLTMSPPPWFPLKPTDSR